MVINGKEIRVLLGAITIYIDIPLGQLPKRKLSDDEDLCLDTLRNRLFDFIEDEYKKCDSVGETEEVKITKCLAIEVIWKFTETELRLLNDALTYFLKVAILSKDKNDLNVYFNGDQYQVIYEDFEQLLGRFKGL